MRRAGVTVRRTASGASSISYGGSARREPRPPWVAIRLCPGQGGFGPLSGLALELGPPHALDLLGAFEAVGSRARRNQADVDLLVAELRPVGRVHGDGRLQVAVVAFLEL